MTKLFDRPIEDEFEHAYRDATAKNLDGEEKYTSFDFRSMRQILDSLTSVVHSSQEEPGTSYPAASKDIILFKEIHPDLEAAASRSNSLISKIIA